MLVLNQFLENRFFHKFHLKSQNFPRNSSQVLFIRSTSFPHEIRSTAHTKYLLISSTVVLSSATFNVSCRLNVFRFINSLNNLKSEIFREHNKKTLNVGTVQISRWFFLEIGVKNVGLVIFSSHKIFLARPNIRASPTIHSRK